MIYYYYKWFHNITYVSKSKTYEGDGVFASCDIMKDDIIFIVDDIKADKVNDGGFKRSDLPHFNHMNRIDFDNFITEYYNKQKLNNIKCDDNKYFRATRNIKKDEELTKTLFPGFWMYMSIIDMYKYKFANAYPAPVPLTRDSFVIPKHGFNVPILQSFLDLYEKDRLTQWLCRGTETKIVDNNNIDETLKMVFKWS